jgi:small subunit ribosomal protein S10
MYKIYLKSFDKNRLYQLLSKWKNTTNLFKLNSNVTSIPSKYTKFTLLKSPHVDKKARAQFEQITFKKYIILKNINNKDNTTYKSKSLLYHIISSTSLEVQLKITESTY